MKAFEALHAAIVTGQLHQMHDDNSAATCSAHTEFHFGLYALAGSAWLLRLIRPVWETAERYCLEVPQCRQLTGRKGEHEAIVSAPGKRA